MRNRWKKAATLCVAFALAAAAAGTSACGAGEISVSNEDITAAGEDISAAGEDVSTGGEEEVSAVITLSDAGISVSGAAGNEAPGVKTDGGVVEITAEGIYEISGSLSDGQIYVEASDDDTVTLLLNGVNLINESEPAIYAENAGKIRIRLAEGSDNLLQSGTSMPEAADENASGGTVFSRDDLTISGSGSLTVNGYINDGIHGNDDLKIKNGNIEVNAVHHAVKANGTITVEGGSLDLTSGADGINSEGDIVIAGGEISVAAGDDGIHADTELTVEDGSVEITDSYEGIEANRIYIEDGDISITSRDDGFNANGGQSRFGFAAMPDNEGTKEAAETEDPELIIDGGTIYVNAGGDGLDSNRDLIVNGGYIIVDGPENSANGAIDSGTENSGVCQINGGTVLAIGASGMAERFGDSSTQASFRLKFDTAGAGTKIIIADASGNEIFAYTSAKSFSSVVFSSPDIEVGEDYVVTIGSESFSFTQDGISYANTSGSGMGGSSGGSRGDIGGGSNRQNGGMDTPGGRPGTSGDSTPQTPGSGLPGTLF